MKQQHGFHVKAKHGLGPAVSDSSSNSTQSGASIPAVGVQGALRAAAGGHWLPAQQTPAGPSLSPAGRLEIVGTATAGGKRLVREVVQGLRACQVRATLRGCHTAELCRLRSARVISAARSAERHGASASPLVHSLLTDELVAGPHGLPGGPGRHILLPR